jgi:putative transposase
MAVDGIDVAVACRVLRISRSAYYDWCSRSPSVRDAENELLLKHIRAIHAESRDSYGWPRVHAELTLGLGVAVNRSRVARLMRQAGLHGLYRRRRGRTTVRDPAAEPATDLVNRQFAVAEPNRRERQTLTPHLLQPGEHTRRARRPPSFIPGAHQIKHTLGSAVYAAGCRAQGQRRPQRWQGARPTPCAS